MAELPSGDVSVRDVTKRYGSVEAVRGVSFDVHAGEIFGLLGPNGAGKTTTLECLLGLRRPDSGTIFVGGINVLTEAKRVREFIGAQLQTSALQDKITAREALTLVTSFYSAPLPVERLLERFRLVEKAGATFDSLSGGQKQRLLLALAFANNPRVIVLDEPTAGLDPQSRRELHDLIAGLRDEGRTIILSTHLIEEAHRLCDRLGILHHGKLIATATPAELIARTRTPTRIVFKTSQPLDRGTVAALPDVMDIDVTTDETRLSTHDVSSTITALINHIDGNKNILLDLQIRRPSLEDVFIELTGTAWADSTSAENGARSDGSNA